MTNTKESNHQMNLRKLSLGKEIQELFKKINAIFQVLNLDDRLEDFDDGNKKEFEYELYKCLATLEVQLNHAMNSYFRLKYPHAKYCKRWQNFDHEKVKTSAAIKPAKTNEESILPVDVDEIRNKRFPKPLSKKTESGHLVGISEPSTATRDSSKKSVKG